MKTSVTLGGVLVPAKAVHVQIGEDIVRVADLTAPQVDQDHVAHVDGTVAFLAGHVVGIGGIAVDRDQRGQISDHVMVDEEVGDELLGLEFSDRLAVTQPSGR